MPRQIIINGKFLSGTRGGVYRVAVELIRALDCLMSSYHELVDQLNFVIFAPKNAHVLSDLKNIKHVQVGYLSGEAWEQIELPWYSRKCMILNLCNIGPLASRNSITWIHDAQIYITPDSYSFLFRFKYRVLQPLICASHKAVVTVSAFSRNELIKAGVVKIDKISVIHNGADHFDTVKSDLSVYYQHGLKKYKYVLAPSAVQAHKNIAMLIKIFTSCTDNNYTLVLYGSASKLEQDNLSIRYDGRVQFVGHISDAELKGLMGNALCLAFPSKTEGFGLPPLEAMRSSTPVVVSRSGALPEICCDAAVYADSNSPQSWSKAFSDLFLDEQLRAKIVRFGLEHSGRFKWEASALKLIDIINRN